VTSLAVRPAVVAQREHRAARRDEDAARGDRAWALVARIQAGDRAAAAELYEMHASQVLGFLAHRAGDRLLAEDLASEVWIRALRRIGSLVRTSSPPVAWLMTIARNLLVDHWKSSTVVNVRPYSAPVDALTVEPADADDDPAETFARYITSRQLLAAVQELTDSQRDVLLHRFFRQHSVEETATAMGLNQGAVKALQYRAVRTLARDLNLADFFPEGD
jgi:RNA polymerase sigma-70 factor (ECF subfamily)